MTTAHAGWSTRSKTIYYSFNAPATGGPALHSLPNLPGVVAAPVHRQVVAYYRPHRIRPLLHPALRGEGVWRPTFADGGSHPPVLVTSFRSDPNYPQMVAGVAWIDHKQTTTWLYPGISEPAVSLPSRGPEEVPMSMRHRLVATFNSGFKIADSRGGYAQGGHTYSPMQPQMATFIRYRSGRIDIRSWSGGTDAGPGITYARQNLPLIVNHGRPNPNLSDGPEWGATLGNAIRVWRSGVGIDRHGNLIYAAANDQTVGSLAADPDPCRSGAGDGARHQHLLDELHHLPVSRRPPRRRTCCPTWIVLRSATSRPTIATSSPSM